MRRRISFPGPRLNDRPFYLAKARAFSVATLSFGPISDQTGRVGVVFSFTPSVYNPGSLSISFSIVGTLPAGLSINSSTGVISGTPTAEGETADLKIRATHSLGFIDSEEFNIDISESLIFTEEFESSDGWT